jgi:hypothetical protein
MTNLSLTDFLLARLAEDEASPPVTAGSRHLVEDRMARECEVKRRIVDEHPAYGGVCCCCKAMGGGSQRFPCLTLRLLALLYADHPDFREKWRP